MRKQGSVWERRLGTRALRASRAAALSSHLSVMTLCLVSSSIGCSGADMPGVEDSAETQAEVRPPRCGKEYCAAVRRTAFGIPHVLAADEKGLGYGLGYAFAQDNLCVLAEAVVTANGDRSKYFGPDESYDATGAGDKQNNLTSDFYFKFLNSEARTRAALNHQSQEVHDLSRGYAAGYNRYLREVGIKRLPVACRNQPWVREIDERDLLRLMRRLAVNSSGLAFIDALFAAEPPGSDDSAAAQSAAPETKPAAAKLSRSGSAKSSEARLGSNGVALGEFATESGKGLLLANPHFPWTTGSRFYQSHLTIPGKVNVMGASLAGFPGINIGFNEQVAWTHTVNTSIHYSFYSLALDPADPTAYFVDGKKKAMTRTATIRVEAKAVDGSLVPIEHAYYLTEFGPVLQWVQGLAFALNDANFDNDRLFQQWWSMAKAKSLTELEKSVEETLGLPWVNVLATDRPGNVYYADVTPVPSIDDSVIAACMPEDFRPLMANGQFILDGSSTACRLKRAPKAPERGIFAAESLPRLERRDFVQNSNDSAWLTNPDQPLIGFPQIVSAEGYPQSGRTRIGLSDIAARLSGADGAEGSAFDMKSLEGLVLSNRSYFAEVLLKELRRACGNGGVVSLEDGSEVNLTKGCRVLAKWDGTANLDSVGWPLFRAWWELVISSGFDFWKVPFDPADPVHTPRGLRVDDPVVRSGAREALGYAMNSLDQRGIDYTRPWGELQVAVRGKKRIPIHGGDGDQIYNAIWSAPIGDGQLDVYYGSSALSIVSFEEGMPKAQGFLTYSQSTDPDSPYFADQTQRFSDEAWIDLPFRESAIASDRDYSRVVISED